MPTLTEERERSARLADIVRLVRHSPFGCLVDGCDELRGTYLEIDAHMVNAHGERPDPNHVAHLMLNPLPGKDHGPAACRVTGGITVLRSKNVTCPVCLTLMQKEVS